MKSVYSLICAALPVVIISGCAQFRITEITASALLTLPAHLISENSEQGIAVGLNDRVVFNLPVFPAVSKDQTLFLIADPFNASVKLFRAGQTVPSRIYSRQFSGSGKNIKHVKVPLDSAGLTAFDTENNVYIQNFPGAVKARNYEQKDTHPAYRLPGELNPASSEFLPSTVIVISEKDQILHTIGPFRKILRLTGGDAGRIWILHEDDSGLTLSLFENGQRKYDFAAGEIATAQEKAKFITETEDIVPVFGAKPPAALASVVYRNNKTYDPVYRRILRLRPAGTQNQVPPSEILRITENGDTFAWVMPDESVYIASTSGESSRILFKIYSPSGEYLSNRLIEYPSPRSAWREYWFDSSGNIYGSRFHRNTFVINQWK